MSNARLMKPLFYDGNFNRDGKKMRAVFEREISDGTVSYRLWRSDGKPDIQYPRCRENDNYLLYAEIRDYLVPLANHGFLSDRPRRIPCWLSQSCMVTRMPAMIISIISASLAMMLSWKLSGVSGKESCSWAATQLAKHPTSRSCLTTMLRVLGASKENGGESFPDYVGALILGELDKCVALSAVYRKEGGAKWRRSGGTKAEAEERHSVKSRIDCPSRPFKKRSEPSKMVVSCKTRL